MYKKLTIFKTTLQQKVKFFENQNKKTKRIKLKVITYKK